MKPWMVPARTTLLNELVAASEAFALVQYDWQRDRETRDAYECALRKQDDAQTNVLEALEALEGNLDMANGCLTLVHEKLEHCGFKPTAAMFYDDIIHNINALRLQAEQNLATANERNAVLQKAYDSVALGAHRRATEAAAMICEARAASYFERANYQGGRGTNEALEFSKIATAIRGNTWDRVTGVNTILEDSERIESALFARNAALQDGIAALEGECKLVRDIAQEGWMAWDADEDTRAGKVLMALAGKTGLRPDLDAARAATPRTDDAARAAS